MKTINFLRPFVIAAILLLIPFTAMQLNIEGWLWTMSDFIFMGILITGVGFAYEFVSTRSAVSSYKVAAGLTTITAFFIIWVNLAVGIIGDEDNPANAMYFGVIFLLILGSIVVQLKPLGMAHTLFVTAFAQFLVPFIALLVWKPASMDPGVMYVVGLNSFLAMSWIVAGILFKRTHLVTH